MASLTRSVFTACIYKFINGTGRIAAMRVNKLKCNVTERL